MAKAKPAQHGASLVLRDKNPEPTLSSEVKRSWHKPESRRRRQLPLNH